jgi:hypothetical protein
LSGDSSAVRTYKQKLRAKKDDATISIFCSDYALASARWLTVQIANIAGTTSA